MENSGQLRIVGFPRNVWAPDRLAREPNSFDIEVDNFTSGPGCDAQTVA